MAEQMNEHMGAETQEVSETASDELAQARQEAAEAHNRYLRARADMDNFRKRMERSAADQTQSFKKQLLSKLLTVKDNLERALQYSDTAATDGEGLREGVRLTMYQLDQILEHEGVRPIESLDTPFDPHTGEAVHRVHDLNSPDHQVVQVARQGYMLGDEVLRPAQVIVNVHGEE